MELLLGKVCGRKISVELVTVVIWTVIICLFAVLFYRTLADVLRICWEKEDYSHGLILPFVSGYVLFLRGDEILVGLSRFVVSRTAIVIGAVLLFLGLSCAIVGEVANIFFIAWVGFFPAIIGVLLITLGWSVTYQFVAPVLLVFMAKPLPDSLVPKLFFPLQVLAAQVSARTLELLDVPVYLLGNIIEIPGMRLMVEEACSGIRSLMALMTVGIIVTLIIPLSRLAQIFIFFLSIVTALALNIFRVSLTGVLAYFIDPSAASGFFHTFSGMIVFIVGLVMVYGAGSLLSTGQDR